MELTQEGDIASHLVEGVDRFLLEELSASEALRGRHWPRGPGSSEAFAEAVTTNRARLARLIGVRDPRVPFEAPEWVATLTRPARVAEGPGYAVWTVRWPSVDGVDGEGLLLAPLGGVARAQVVVVPDATQTPEELAGIVPGVRVERQTARRLAEHGCRVLVPTVVDRGMGPHAGRARMTAREFLHRPAFELGRHLIGYEVQKILAAVDWMARETEGNGRVGVVGWGDGGMLALYAAAVDTRIHAALVSGYFGDRREVWRQPIDRSVFGLLERFGDAELAVLIHPRRLWVDPARAPEAQYSGQGGGAPAEVTTPGLEEVIREVRRAQRLSGSEGSEASVRMVDVGDPDAAGVTEGALRSYLLDLVPGMDWEAPHAAPRVIAPLPDAAMRQVRQMRQIEGHTQRLLVESPYVRAEFMKGLDTTSMEGFRRTVGGYREYFATEVIGRFDRRLEPFRARTRKVYEKEAWTGYEVVLDVFPDVIAYGLLLLPNDLRAGERRPVVVCQHGLEGRPQDTIGEAGFEYYAAFSARLAERGFITFAPQNLYIFGDRFRTLQRKAYPLGKTLFSIMVPQHQQITEWLKTQPYVDPERIAFYGLSYGGKSAMRIPPLVGNYCLSICSADFNEWVWKNASTRSPYSYVWTGEYEIFEFDLGSTFNYAEMAALIAPRPFMVERGHFDGVAPDETVAYEFAKVRHLYAARLGLPPGHCEIEWFVGPHRIHGVGTYEFLHRHLDWPRR
ncbi:MAG: dienelactone hydrolase family protein [Verrucomicrobiae bacterium]|nr:dienelactone hydrolase family protein [Verrucomicrobiae bacterium]